MRYLNWDVLLFPEGSKVPIQEFKTGCFVTQDPESTQSQTLAGPYVGYAINQNPRQLPTVTCFVANLPPGFPFRVSVHSWEPPTAHRTTCSMATHEDQVYFEGRVLIDGICVAGSLFNQKYTWPVVIDTSLHLDKAGNRDSLKFPPFHQEMLTQSWWNAGENIGRVKVIISEGIARGHGASPFERLRNIVSFSFQHAPISILEASGMAWPNPGMWYQPAGPSYNASSSRKVEEADIDAHGHSPRRRSESFGSDRDKSEPTIPAPPTFQRPMAPPALPAHGSDLKNTHWPPPSTMHDPFVEAGMLLYRRWRSGSEDQSMPDYSDNAISASTPSITHNSVTTKSGIGLPHEQDSFDDMLNISSPDKDGLSGYFAPANSRASSAANTPSIRTKPSALAEARKASYSHEHTRAVSITIREPLVAANRQKSDVSMASRFSDENVAFNVSLDSKVPGKPTGDVKGRKEGRGNELDVPQKGLKKASARSASQRDMKEEKASQKMGETGVVVSDSKRKRSVRIAPQEDHMPGSSPSRKISKTGSYESSLIATLDGSTGEGDLARAPLCSVENMAREA